MHQITRRWMLKAGASSSMLLATGVFARAQQSLEGPIVVGSRGGYIGEAEKEILWEPFSERHGVEVVQFEADDTDAIIQAQQQAGNVQLSYSITTDGGYKILTEKDYLEKIDYSKFSPEAAKVVESMPEGTVRDYGIAVSTIGVNLAFDERAFPEGGPQPKTWQDFWDTETYPGSRSLYNGPIFTMEIALLADGVDPSELYPIDVERAFAKLEQIKPSVVKWWSAGAEAPQLLIDQEAAMAIAYNGRVEGAVEGGAPLAYSWDKALTYHDYAVLPKGGPHLDTALAALSMQYEPEVAAALSAATRYPIPSPVVWEAAPADIRNRWPNAPQNASQLAKMDFLWWAQPAEGGDGRTNQEVLTERFNAFVAS
jgi:putative spermidine/putrescine transport system substrate-binding protein